MCWKASVSVVVLSRFSAILMPFRDFNMQYCWQTYVFGRFCSLRAVESLCIGFFWLPFFPLGFSLLKILLGVHLRGRTWCSSARWAGKPSSELELLPEVSDSKSWRSCGSFGIWSSPYLATSFSLSFCEISSWQYWIYKFFSQVF